MLLPFANIDDGIVIVLSPELRKRTSSLHSFSRNTDTAGLMVARFAMLAMNGLRLPFESGHDVLRFLAAASNSLTVCAPM